MNWKEIGKYAKYGLYIIPGYGIVDQYKKPKEKRSKVGIIAADVVAAFFVIKYIVFPSYVLIKGAATGVWHPFRFNKKEKTEQIEKRQEKEAGKLEKTIEYQDWNIHFPPKDL